MEDNYVWSCSKIDSPFVKFLVTFTYVEINFDQYLQLTNLGFSGKAKKMLSIDISHIYGGYVEKKKRQARVWVNLEANLWRLTVSVLHLRVIFLINHMIENIWWWEMISNGLKSPNDLYLEAKNKNTSRYGG